LATLGREGKGALSAGEEGGVNTPPLNPSYTTTLAIAALGYSGPEPAHP